jgi:HEXXH motif-containing protein
MVDQHSLVRTLLNPGVNDTLRELRFAHLQEDLASLSAFAQKGQCSEKNDGLATALRAFEFCLDDLPACGGLHGTPRKDVVAAAVGCVCESALYDACADRVTVDAPALQELALPRSGLTIILPVPSDVRCSASSDAVTITADGGELARIGRGTAGGLELIAAAPGVRALRRFVASGVPVEGGYLRYGEHLPPSADVLDRSLSAEEKDHLQVALGLLHAAAPGLYDEIHEEKVRLIALQPRPGVLRQSCSFRSAPGLVFVNMSDPLEVLDLLCHEYHHLKLFRVQETATLMHRPAIPVRAPWRADRRTSEGLLHGTYVFYMCAWLLDMLYEVFPPSQRGRTRLMMFRACIEAGLAELERTEPEFSPLGRSLIDAIHGGNDAAIARLEAASPAAVRWARYTVKDHMARVGTAESREPWFLGI